MEGSCEYDEADAGHWLGVDSSLGLGAGQTTNHCKNLLYDI